MYEKSVLELFFKEKSKFTKQKSRLELVTESEVKNARRTWADQKVGRSKVWTGQGACWEMSLARKQGSDHEWTWKSH
jgi:hypothetical protein